MAQFAVASHSPPSTSSQEWRNSNNPHCPATAKRSILRLRDATTWDANANQAALQLRPTTETAMTLECVTGLTTNLAIAIRAIHRRLARWHQHRSRDGTAQFHAIENSCADYNPTNRRHGIGQTTALMRAEWSNGFTAPIAAFQECVNGHRHIRPPNWVAEVKSLSRVKHRRRIIRPIAGDQRERRPSSRRTLLRSLRHGFVIHIRIGFDWHNLDGRRPNSRGNHLRDFGCITDFDLTD